MSKKLSIKLEEWRSKEKNHGGGHKMQETPTMPLLIHSKEN